MLVYQRVNVCECICFLIGHVGPTIPTTYSATNESQLIGPPKKRQIISGMAWMKANKTNKFDIVQKIYMSHHFTGSTCPKHPVGL